MRFLVLLVCALFATKEATGLTQAEMDKYTFFTVKKTFDEAVADCQSRGDSLAVIANADVNSYVISKLNAMGVGNQDAYISARKSDGVFKTLSGAAFPYTNWNVHEPSGNGYCGYMWGAVSLRWDDASCYGKRNYICEEGTGLTQAEMDKFTVFTDKRTFDEAVTACQDIGGSLAVVSSPLVNSYLVTKLKEAGVGGQNAYFSNYKRDGVFKTLSGEALPYTNWNNGEPSGNGNCGYFWGAASLRWDDASCSQKINYICETDEGLTQAEKDRYTVFTDKKTFDEAVAACQSTGASLAVIANAHVNAYLIGQLNSLGVGREDAYFSARKSDGVYKTLSGAAFPYTNWNIHEPTGNGYCGYMWGAVGLRWDDASCYDRRNYICEEGTGLTQNEMDKYTVFTDKKTFDEAVAACQSRGTSLAVVPSPLVNSYLVTKLKEAGVGGQDTYFSAFKSGGVFKTLSGEVLPYTNWNNGEPSGNGNCGYFWAAISLRWDDAPCSTRRNYICEEEEVVPTEAPPTEAPPTEAPPTEAPPTEAPPTEKPKTEAPPPPGTTYIPTLEPCQFPALRNVAQGKTATQSSDRPRKDSEAANAVDGNYNSDANTGSCSWTNKEYQPWWKVDLGQSFDIYEVVITNRADCCLFRLKNAEIRVGNSANFAENPVCGRMILGRMVRDQPIHIRCGCETSMSGRYVSVQIMDREQQLHMCEVEIMAL